MSFFIWVFLLLELTPKQRTLRARLAAHESWANTPDPVSRTTAGRAAFLSQFEQQVDPDGTLEPAERARRAEHARKAHFTRLALASSKARAGRTGRTPDGEAA